MKTLRLLLALSCVSALLAGYAFAGDKDQCKGQDKTKDQPACTCGKDKDGKTCGVDKDCCCTGAKASKDNQKQEQKDQKQDVKNNEAGKS